MTPSSVLVVVPSRSGGGAPWAGLGTWGGTGDKRTAMVCACVCTRTCVCVLLRCAAPSCASLVVATPLPKPSWAAG